jgi:iron complex outermembrane receptor protein
MSRGLPALYSLSGMGTMRAGIPINNAFIDRIEVPKGPSGTISGTASFGGRGGVVNLVRKEAGGEPRRDLAQTGSSQDSGTGRLEADLAGRMTDDMSWRVVTVGSATGPADGGYQQRGGVGGVLASSRLASGDWSATLTMQTDRSQIVPPRNARGGVLQQDGSITPIEPGEAAPVDPDDRLRVASADTELNLDWRFAPRWRLNLKTRVEAVDTDLRLHQLLFSLEGRRVSWWSAALQGGLVGDVTTGPVRHQLLLGVDVAQWRTRLQDQQFIPGNLGALGRLDARDVKRELMLQDLLRLGNLRVRLAGQVTRVPVFDQNGVGTGQAQVNWDAGALYRLSPAVSVYAGSQRSVETDIIRTISTALATGVLEPTRTRQSQAGLKLDLLDDRLTATLEGFTTEQVNYPAFDGSQANPFIFVPLRSVRGVELDLSGRPYAGWDLQIGMSFLQAEDRLSGLAGTGDLGPLVPAAAVPQRSMHLLTRVHLPGRWLPQTSLSLAFRARSSSFAVPPNPQFPGLQLVLPGSADLNLSLERRVGKWSFSTFIRNVFDRDVYESQSAPGAIPLEPGRSLGLSVSWKGRSE